MSHFSNERSVTPSRAASEAPVARHRPPLQSSVRRAERADRSPRQSFAPARNSGGSAAPAANAFASLEQEATRVTEISPELLERARQEAAAKGGATQVYEVPPELLQMARENRRKRAAAQLARLQADAANSTPETATAKTIPPEAPAAPAAAPAPESAVVLSAEVHDASPDVSVTETDLSMESVEELLRLAQTPEPAPVGLAQSAEPPAAAAEADVTPDLAGARPARPRAARRILAALCLVALCAGGAWGGKLLLDRYGASLPTIGALF